jgi:hypothetical protein
MVIRVATLNFDEIYLTKWAEKILNGTKKCKGQYLTFPHLRSQVFIYCFGEVL